MEGNDPGPAAIAVYNAIAAYAWEEAEAWPSQTRVAEDLGCTREHVNRMVRALQRAGWLEIEKRKGKTWLFNVYHLLEAWKPPTKAFVRAVVSRARQRSITLTGFSRRSRTFERVPKRTPVVRMWRPGMGKGHLTGANEVLEEMRMKVALSLMRVGMESLYVR